MKSISMLVVFFFVTQNVFADVSVLACKAQKIYDDSILSPDEFNLGIYSNVDIAVDTSDQARVWFGTHSYELGEEASSQVIGTIRELKYIIDPYGNNFQFVVTKNMIDESGMLYVKGRGSEKFWPIADLNCSFDSSVVGQN